MPIQINIQHELSFQTKTVKSSIHQNPAIVYENNCQFLGYAYCDSWVEDNEYPIDDSMEGEKSKEEEPETDEDVNCLIKLKIVQVCQLKWESISYLYLMERSSDGKCKLEFDIH